MALPLNIFIAGREFRKLVELLYKLILCRKMKIDGSMSKYFFSQLRVR